MNKYEIITRSRKFLEPDEDILFALLFGSKITGRAGPLSDIDFAIYLKHRPFDNDQKLQFEKKLEILTRLIKEFGDHYGDNVDLLILNNNYSPVVYNVLNTGIAIFIRNNEDLIEFRLDFLRKFMDFEYFRKTHYSCTLGAQVR
ncbi:MAG: nucleotidyltransferase domain-containing protein [Actinobacteria bacterium]|nr:nucleotidyltransferase domain-containing protein [Actinomycetota bacterium]